MNEKNEATNVNDEIKGFIGQDLVFAVESTLDGEYKHNKHIGCTVPSEIKPLLKKLWLATEPMRRDAKNYADYKEGKKTNYKPLSNHKSRTVLTTARQLSTEYIVTTMRAHHFMTFFLYPFSLETGTSFLSGPVKIDFMEIMGSNVTMTELLKSEKIKEIFDTDEINTLHSFNYLRNSLAHSADYSAFIFLTPEYYALVNKLLDDVINIFDWLSMKAKFTESKGVKTPISTPLSGLV